MNRDNQPKYPASPPAAKHLRIWLRGLIALVLMAAAAVFLLPQFINTASIKQKIRAAITERIGGQVDFQAIDLSYFPRPAIELHQVSLNIPGKVQGNIPDLRLAPALSPLLHGTLRLARLELDAAQLNLEIPETNTAESPAQPVTFATLDKELKTVIEPFVQGTPSLSLRISNARLTLSQSTQKLVGIEDLDLQLSAAVHDLHSVHGDLRSRFSQVNIYRNGIQEMVKDTSLDCTFQIEQGKITVSLDQLTLTEPSLELNGSLTVTETSPAITLSLSSSDIDVAATRRTALALAGDTSPTRDIFDYLRGGHIPQISFSFHGDNFTELGDLDNIIIKGKLQDGKVSIPAITLDLTEVEGDVLISQGVLQATGVSTRLEGSSGRDGSLRVGLTADNDLFQLELTLSADLAETKTILHRVVEDPLFIAELEKITNLQGTGNGRLILGDSLKDLNARVEASDLKVSADYQRVPWPITITQGKFTFSKETLSFSNLAGTLGKSQFAEISFKIQQTKDITLDISAGKLDLVTAELYPWLASLKGLRGQLQKVRRMNGQLKLSTLRLNGTIGKASGWQFASTGTVRDLSLDTELFPDPIALASGGFTFNTRQLTLTGMRAASQDAELTLTGSFKGLPQRLDRIELAIAGHMGPQSVTWFSDTFGLPKTYAIRAPLTIGNAKVSWQPDDSVSCTGEVSIDGGPKITGNVDYHRGLLQIHQLDIKDQYSDASLVADLRQDLNEFRFSGKLQDKTLRNLFIDNPFNGGLLEGNLEVIVPKDRQTRITGRGQLIGKNLPIPLPADNKVDIDQVSLRADGSKIRADFTRLNWQDLIWEPVRSTVSLDHDRADVRLDEARMCGINSPGLFSITREELSIDTVMEGKDLNVATSYTCLTRGHVEMTGSLDISSKLTAQGKFDQLIRSLDGPLHMTFTNGVIKKDPVLATILELLNVTEVVKGRLPNLTTNGFAYTTITVDGMFHDGKLTIDKLYMDGDTLDVVGKGTIRLEKKTVDFQLLASPFKTANSIIKHIPGLNYLLNDSLVSIPLSVSGALADPKVLILSPTAVGSSLLDLAKRTLTAPFKLLEAMNPFREQK